MKENSLSFFRRVAFTTCLSFLLISFLFIGMIALFDDSSAQFERFVFFRYILGKLGCILLFSLSLGFINRLMETKKNHALMRLTHFVLSLAAFGAFMIFCFYSLFDMDTITVRGALFNLCLFVLFYFLVLALCGLGRRIFWPKSNKDFRGMV